MSIQETFLVVRFRQCDFLEGNGLKTTKCLSGCTQPLRKYRDSGGLPASFFEATLVTRVSLTRLKYP